MGREEHLYKKDQGAEDLGNIKTFFCYDPETIKHGIGSSANGRSVKDDYDNLNSCISQARGKGAKMNWFPIIMQKKLWKTAKMKTARL